MCDWNLKRFETTERPSLNMSWYSLSLSSVERQINIQDYAIGWRTGEVECSSSRFGNGKENMYRKWKLTTTTPWWPSPKKCFCSTVYRVRNEHARYLYGAAVLALDIMAHVQRSTDEGRTSFRMRAAVETEKPWFHCRRWNFEDLFLIWGCSCNRLG